MKLGSKECDEKLRDYVTNSLFEELAVELLLIPDDDLDNLREMAYKICDLCSNDEDIEKLQNVIINLKDYLGIED